MHSFNSVVYIYKLGENYRLVSNISHELVNASVMQTRQWPVKLVAVLPRGRAALTGVNKPLGMWELRTSASAESDPPAAPARRVTGKHTHVRARCKLVRI